MVVADEYIIAITHIVKTSGVKYITAYGNNGNIKRIIPYVPNFNKTPARITEPAVGASTCASGNQIWTGNIGTLTAKEQKKANQRNICLYCENSVCANN